MNYIIQLTNKKTGQIITKEVNDLNDGEKLYFKFSLDMREFEDGEYDLELTESGQLILTDILYIGDYQPNSLQYKRGDNTFIEIVLDAKFQDKEVEITEIETVVKTDEDYDGFKEVIIDATPLYENAYEIGNKDGYETGIKIQKELLETLTVTENGTYTKEDGYNEVIVNVPDLNGDYDTGYEDGFVDGKETGVNQAGEIIAETAQVLDITENGIYGTKYSGIIQEDNTGVYPNGDKFYNYLTLNDVAFNTGIVPTPNTRIELWYKQNELKSGRIICASVLNNNYFELNTSLEKDVMLRFGDSSLGLVDIRFFLKSGWNHIIFSQADGLILNGNKLTDLSNAKFNNKFGSLVINTYIFGGGLKNSNGSFGMLKIDDVIIIPTENGFLNTKTNTYCEKQGNGTFTFDETEKVTFDGDLIKTVNVNVEPKINIFRNGIKFTNSKFNKIPEWADFSEVTDFKEMFYLVPVTDGLYNLTLGEKANIISMFESTALTDLSFLETWTYPPTISFTETFGNCKGIRKCPAIYMEGKDDYYCGCPFFANTILSDFTDFGGFVGLKYKMDKDNCFPKCPNLTYQSCINILNGLYDFTGNGETPTSSQGKLKVHSNFLTTVGDEISIATNKGWQVTA